MLAANRLVNATCLLKRATTLIQCHSRATFIKGHWPEPFTQQTLKQFLGDIDYFEQPSEYISIGINLETSPDEASQSQTDLKFDDEQLTPSIESDVDRLLDMLGEDVSLPPLDVNDAMLDQKQVKNLAISHGIYRDLFSLYEPRKGHIKFTAEQAERMSKLVPHYWISDQPFARVDRHLKKTGPLYYFEPIIGVSARFVHDLKDENARYAHTAYHGNIIPASEALVKPSITLDGRWFQSRSMTGETTIDDSKLEDWSSGQVSLQNFDGITDFHTLLLLNLDSLHPNSANLHWMLTNIRVSKSGVDFDEACKYLPVHGIRGFGHSRYVFLLLRHQSAIDTSALNLTDFAPKTRRFNVLKFIQNNERNDLKPVGMSWFQTVWDHSSNTVFHDFMGISAPVYELVQEKLAKRDMIDKAYPGKIPFNIFMDHYRDPKEINEKVLMERLKSVDPFDYKDQYVPPKVPSTVFQDENLPSWMKIVMFKKNNKIGQWRGLRPASALIPLNNNADLDHPIRPLRSTKKRLPGTPNQYPAKPKMKLLKDLPYSKPINEHPNVYIQEDHDVHINKVHEMMKEFKKGAQKT